MRRHSINVVGMEKSGHLKVNKLFNNPSKKVGNYLKYKSVKVNQCKVLISQFWLLHSKLWIKLIFEKLPAYL